MYRDLWPSLPATLRRHLPSLDAQPSFSSDSAGFAFYCIGTGARPAVIRASSNRNPAVREAAVSALCRFFVGVSLATNEAILLFTKSLADNDAGVRIAGVMGIESIGSAASNATPALVMLLHSSEAGRRRGWRFFVRASSARALASIGPAAAGAIPALTNLLSSADSDSYLRVNAAHAIWRISSNDSIVLPVIMTEMPALKTFLSNNGSGLTWIALQTMKEMGPRAKAAFPLLLNELTNSDDDSRIRVLETMRVIDPEAAAEADVK
jgi:HEAT repeat protein